MKLTFHGGARSVTGANYLLEADDGTRVLVDCGLRQGGNFCDRGNWEAFPYNPASIDALFITHAHIDHIGRIPKLIRDGFRGVIFSTPPTKAAAELLLKDADHIMAQDAERCGQEVLFMADDVDRALGLWQTASYHEQVHKGMLTATFYNAGHILGSSFITVTDGSRRVVFSGDLGNSPTPLLGAREPIPADATHCLIESTYGGRIHEDVAERRDILKTAIESTVRRGGVLMIPAFAMERTQELLFELDDLVTNNRIPRVPVFLDSPLAIKLTDVYKRFDSYLYHDPERSKHRRVDHLFDFPGLKQTTHTEDSKAIADVPGPKVIIAGSGMSHGGRILHHERAYLSDPKNMLLIVGFQAVGSLGRRILDGAREVKIFGETIPVRCQVQAIGGYSAHADQPQLISWLSSSKGSMQRAFVVQGEEDQALVLAEKIKTTLSIQADVPLPGDEVVL